MHDEIMDPPEITFRGQAPPLSVCLSLSAHAVLAASNPYQQLTIYFIIPQLCIIARHLFFFFFFGGRTRRFSSSPSLLWTSHHITACCFSGLSARCASSVFFYVSCRRSCRAFLHSPPEPARLLVGSLLASCLRALLPAFTFVAGKRAWLHRLAYHPVHQRFPDPGDITHRFITSLASLTDILSQVLSLDQ